LHTKSATIVAIFCVLLIAAFVAGALVGPDIFSHFGPLINSTTEAPPTVPEATSARAAGVPEKAYTVLKQILANHGESPPGYVGGRTFYNDGRDGEQLLPPGISYREYDVNPRVKGQNRGAERLVIGSDGSAWYTANHYRTYTRIR
jgi:guanyl-specific ribonuclease Sa